MKFMIFFFFLYFSFFTESLVEVTLAMDCNYNEGEKTTTGTEKN